MAYNFTLNDNLFLDTYCKEPSREDYENYISRQSESIRKLRVLLNDEIALSERRYRVLMRTRKDLNKANEQITILNNKINDQCLELAKKDIKCRVCAENNIEYIFLPCYHALTCEKCKNLTKCPKCNGEINEIKKFST